MKVFIIIASTLLVALNVFDIFSTIVVLNNGGEEANPFMSWLMDLIGVVPAMLLMKIIFVGLLILVGFKAANKNYILSTREFVVLIGAYVVLIVFYSYFMFSCNLPYVTIYL